MNMQLSEPAGPGPESDALDWLLAAAEELHSEAADAIEAGDCPAANAPSDQLSVIMTTWLFPVPRRAALELTTLSEEKFHQVHEAALVRLQARFSGLTENVPSSVGDLADCGPGGLEALRAYVTVTTPEGLKSKEATNRLRRVVEQRWLRAETARKWTLTGLLEALQVVPDCYLLFRLEHARAQWAGVPPEERARLGDTESLPWYLRRMADELDAWRENGALRVVTRERVRAWVTAKFQSAHSTTVEALSESRKFFQQAAETAAALSSAAGGGTARLEESIASLVKAVPQGWDPDVRTMLQEKVKGFLMPSKLGAMGASDMLASMWQWQPPQLQRLGIVGQMLKNDLLARWQAPQHLLLPCGGGASSHVTWSASGVLEEGMGVFFAEKQSSDWLYVEVLLEPQANVQGLRCRAVDTLGNVICVSEEFELQRMPGGESKGSVAFAVPEGGQPLELEWERRGKV
jgi:hypothetical protein